MARKSSADRSVELDNRREIGSLKDVLSQLNTTVAINTEATKSLKEVVEREFNRHSEDRKGLDARVSLAETQIEQIRVDMAHAKSIKETLERFDKSMSGCESRLVTIETWINNKTGISTGVLWAFSVCSVPAIGCIAYGLDTLIHKIWG